MNGTFQPNLELLPEAQRKIWQELRPLNDSGFVLYGGTAIALRLGHRVSVDFDFFSDHPVDKIRLLKSIPALNSGTVVQDSPESWTLLVSNSPGQPPVKVSFFGSIPFGRIGEPERTDDGTLCVASLLDLLALTLKVILQRIESKDYQDIAALLKSGLFLEAGLAGARCFFGSAFQPAECLKALIYFEGGDLTTLPSELRRILLNATKNVKKIPHVAIVSRMLG